MTEATFIIWIIIIMFNISCDTSMFMLPVFHFVFICGLFGQYKIDFS